MNGIELIAHILKTEGVKWLACFPNNPLIEAAAKEGIRPILFRHERGAVMAADGYSRTSDRERFGVVAVQSQAGAENAMGGLAQAFADNVPILMLPGGLELDHIGVRPNFSATQRYQGLVKRVEAVLTPDQITAVMRRAFHALRSGPPGPVVVEMSSDVCDREVPALCQDYHAPRISRQVPSAGDAKEAVKLLLEARRPLIWAGGGVLSSRATQELKELAELTGTPVFCTLAGKSAFDERHPLSLGAGSRAMNLAARTWILGCDLLLAVGASLTRSPYAEQIPTDTVIVQSTINPDDVNKDESVAVGLVGDARLTLAALVDEVKAQSGEQGQEEKIRQVSAEIAALKKQWIDEWLPLLTSAEEPLNPYRVIHAIDQTLDRENSIVTHDAGAPRDSILPFYTATVPHSYVGWGRTTHLGFSIPLMIGAKLAHPGKFCLNLMGDGAFGMSGLDIETAVRAGVPITTVVLNNGDMATYPGGFPIARERYAVSRLTGDYASLAEGMGATGIVVKKVDEMAPAIVKAQQLNADGKTALIDVHTSMESRQSRWALRAILG